MSAKDTKNPETIKPAEDLEDLPVEESQQDNIQGGSKIEIDYKT